jgi:hypothetical protein
MTTDEFIELSGPNGTSPIEAIESIAESLASLAYTGPTGTAENIESIAESLRTISDTLTEIAATLVFIHQAQ